MRLTMCGAALTMLAAMSTGAAAEPVPGELRDIAAPVEMPEDPRWPLYAGTAAGISVLAAMVGYFLHRRRVAARAEAAELARRPRPPHEIALNALGELDITGPSKAFYTELVTILRAYIERHYAIGAADETSSELLETIHRTRSISEEHEALLRAILSEADLVKFAAAVPSGDAPARSLERCRSFVQQTAEEAIHAF